MLSSTIAAMLLMASSPAAVQVDVGRVNVEKLPALKRVGMRVPTPAMVTEVEKILSTGKCELAGQTSRRFDIDVPYAILVEPDGAAHRVVVADMGCPELETFAGLVVLNLARIGEFKPSSPSKARWFGSTINFNLQ